MSQIGESVYKSKWYIQKLDFQKKLYFIIMKSQMVFNFTAGGMVHINRSTFVEVTKKNQQLYLKQFLMS